MNHLTLYTYARSSAAYRVRIALALKGLAYESRFVHLLKEGGENYQPAFVALNPQALIPLLIHGDHKINQSLSILEYLEETFGGYALLPSAPADRAWVRAIAQMVACDIHPLNNLRIIDYIKLHYTKSNDMPLDWYHRWIAEGFAAIEILFASRGNADTFAMGNAPGLADCLLIPQIYNAYRFNLDMSPYPRLEKLYQAAMKIDAIIQASPEQQADFES